MKKLFFVILILIGIMAVPISASAAGNNVTVVLPTYKCIINDNLIYFNDSQYPLLSYKNITYFPMTWNYCRAMDLVTGWVDGEGLYIASKPTQNKPDFAVYPLNKNVKNKSKMTATKVTYPVYIDGEEVPADETYPLLNFRGITYFPMTWTYANNMFGWNLSFITNDGMGNRIFKVETLPNHTKYIDNPVAEKYGIYYQKIIDGYYDGKLYFLNYVTGETTSEAITEEKKKEIFDSNIESFESKDVSNLLSLKGDKIYYNGKRMCNFKALTDKKVDSDNVELYASENTQNGITYLVIKGYYQLNIPAPYTPFETYTFIKDGAEYHYVTDCSQVINVGKLGSDTYIEVRKYSGYRGTTYNYSILFKLDSTGKVVNLNETSQFSDYNSVSLIGIANNKAYLKCLWSPEATLNPAYIESGEENMTVSPVNDGFFTYDGNNLKQIHKYIFSNEELVTSWGAVYITNNHTGVLRKV